MNIHIIFYEPTENIMDDIVLIVGDDLKDLKYEGVIVKYFKNISFPDSVVRQMDDVNTDGRNLTKRFQWHKLHIFQSYFKQWKWVLYIDCGMKIYEDLLPFFSLCTPPKNSRSLGCVPNL